MTDFRPALEIKLDLPDDLREWLDEATLVRLIFDALHTLEQDFTRSGSDRLAIGQPRILLTLLTYSYATGRYGSQEIEREAAHDPQLLYLSAKTAPVAGQLRQFRRHHRAWLYRGLGRLLESAWRTRHDCPLDQPLTAGHKEVFDWAAEERINRAVLTDTMALDE